MVYAVEKDGKYMNRKILSWVLVVLWMSLIFYLSHQPATESNKLSREITEKIVKVVEEVASDTRSNPKRLNHIIRKGAHFFAYFILGILLMYSLYRNHTYGLKAASIALSICILYAISDEVHQIFIPGRSGQLADVILDSAGGIVGILSYKAYRLNIFNKSK